MFAQNVLEHSAECSRTFHWPGTVPPEVPRDRRGLKKVPGSLGIPMGLAEMGPGDRK